jgi:hypothetical protein
MYFALFFRTIDGLLRDSTLENSDQNGLLIVLTLFTKNSPILSILDQI